MKDNLYKRSESSIKMKIQNIAAMLDENDIKHYSYDKIRTNFLKECLFISSKSRS